MSEQRNQLQAEYKQMWIDLPNPTRITEANIEALKAKEEVMFAHNFSQNDLDALVSQAKFERKAVCQ